MEFNNKNEKGLSKFLADKGFYIVLFICAAVIGVCAWLLWFSAGSDDAETETKTHQVTDYDKAEINVSPMDNMDEELDKEPVEDEDTLSEEDNAVSVGQWEDDSVEAEEGTSETEENIAESQETSVPSPEDMPCVMPVSGEITVAYSIDDLVYNKTMADWRTHDGVDIAADMGAKVKSIAAGTVQEVFEDDMFGTTVVIDHGNGLVSTYSNLASTPAVSAGDTVAMGDVIGSVGDTALAEINEVTHLHLSMTLNGESVNPEDYI